MTLTQAAELLQIALDDPYVRDLRLDSAEDRQQLLYWLTGALVIADNWPCHRVPQ